MKRGVPRRSGIACLALCLVVGSVAPFAPSAASAQTPRVPVEQDTHLFRYILGRAKLTGLDGAGEIDEPARTIVIVLGKTDTLDQLWPSAREFVKQGGALLAATDSAREGGRLELPFQVTVREGLLLRREGSPDAYHGFPDCPLVKPVDVQTARVFQDLDQVATNVPGYFSLVDFDLPRGLSVLARFPEGCVAGGRQLLRPPFAIGGNLGKGRVLLLSDHSVFINCMMMPQDNDNFSFATNCVDWLREGSSQRDRVLYVEDGRVRNGKDFEVKLKQIYLPVPPPEDLLALGNQMLADLENKGQLESLADSNAFYQALAQHVSPTAVRRIVLILLTVGLLAFGWLLLGRSRHRHESAAPLFAQAVVQLAPAGPGVDERHQALLEARNLWETGRSLARQFFEAVPGTGMGDQGGPPRVLVGGAWWRRWRVHRQVRQWWELAYGRRTVRISPRRFARLAEQLNEAKKDLAQGTWRFAEPNKTGR